MTVVNLRVSDLDGLVASLRHRHLLARVHDPEGHELELCGPPDEADHR